MLAQITQVGGRFPDGAPTPLGDVLIWSAEDDIADTIGPRLLAAGADPKRVKFPDRVPTPDGGKRHFDPAIDMPGLLADCRAHPDIKVVLVDPVVSAITGDSHNNAETRRGLQPLVDFAAETGIAVLGITHFTKGTQGKDPLERITGSLAFGALARVVWGASKGEDEAAPRRLVRIKNNIEQSGGGFEYTLQQVPLEATGSTAQTILWGQRIEGSARDLMEGTKKDAGKEAQAMTLLETLLRPAGTAGVLRNDLKVHAEDQGISWRTMEDAKAKRGDVESFKGLGSNQAPWYWRFISSNESRH